MTEQKNMEQLIKKWKEEQWWKKAKMQCDTNVPSDFLSKNSIKKDTKVFIAKLLKQRKRDYDDLLTTGKWDCKIVSGQKT